MDSYDMINNVLEELDYQKAKMISLGTVPNIQVRTMPEGAKLFCSRGSWYPIFIRDSKGRECVIECLESSINISTLVTPGCIDYICNLADPNSLNNLRFVLM